MKIKSSWEITDKEILNTKVEFVWNITLGEVRELGRLISDLEDYCDDSKDRNVLREYSKRFLDIYKVSENKLKDTTVEVEIDPNPNAIKL